MRRSKTLAFLLICLCLIGCGLPQAANTEAGIVGYQLSEPETAGKTAAVPAQEELPQETVSTYSDYLLSNGDQPVTIESYLQEKDAWNEGKTNIWLQDEEGAYYIYSLPCSLEEYEALDQGRKLRISGYKAEFSGQLQLTDAVFFLLDGTYLASPFDASAFLGSDELYLHQNQRVRFRDLKIEPMFDGVSAFYYGWDNSGSPEKQSDLYFTASNSGEMCTFLIKSSLRGTESEVYRAVQNLRIGDTVNLEGILSWYNGPQPLVTVIASIHGG